MSSVMKGIAMSRTLFALVLLACPALSHAAAPPRSTQVRFLSLREAIATALENRAGQSGSPRSDAEQQRERNRVLLNVEVAYWNLYGSYWMLYTREQGLRFAAETFKHMKQHYKAGKVNTADLNQARGQYELFRAQRLNAIDTLRENEQQLRQLMGLSGYGGEVFLPADVPTLAASKPDWKAALKQALQKRPEVEIARGEVEGRKTRIRHGVFLDTLPATAEKPLGGMVFPNKAYAQEWLDEAQQTLKDTEIKAESFLALQYRRVGTAYEQIRANRAQREAFGEQLRIRTKGFEAGRATLDILLEAQRFWADALNNEYQQIVAYNNALAGFEFAKGAIAARHNLSGCGDQARTADVERRLTQQVVQRLPALPAKRLLPGTGGASSENREEAPNFAAVWKGFTPEQIAAFRAEW